MMEFTTNAYIGTENISTKQLETGVICLLHGVSELTIHTLEYLNTNNEWVTDSGVTIIPEQRLMKFVAVKEDGIYPIGIKDWPIIIKHKLNFKPSLSFIIKPHKFKKGNSLQICSKCNASFIASKYQPYCEKCCHSLSVAYLKDKYKTVKPIEKMFKHSIVETLLKEAFALGAVGITSYVDFEKWINNKLNK